MKIGLYALLSVLLVGPASAQQPVTVKSLLSQDFAVVGAVTSPVGPGVFLQKKDKLFVGTRYCKPVE